MPELSETILAEVRALRAEVACLRAPVAEPISLSVKEAAALAGCKSPTAFYSFKNASGLKAYRQGKYRRADVLHAINRLSHAASLRARADAFPTSATTECRTVQQRRLSTTETAGRGTISASNQ